MKVIPASIHGFIDYTWGALLAASPWLFNYARRGPDLCGAGPDRRSPLPPGARLAGPAPVPLVPFFKSPS